MQTEEKKLDTAEFSEPQAMSNIAEDQNTLGQIKINHSVVASIVRLAALEVEGVHAVGGGLVDGIAEMFSKKESDRGVRVAENDHGQYVIDVRVILRFGMELAKVALAIQENVSNKVSHMTMQDIACVNIIIDGVKMKESSKKEESDWAHESHTD